MAAIAVVCLLGSGGALAASARRSGRPAAVSVRVGLHAPGSVLAGGLVSFTGTVSGVTAARMVVQRRSAARWVPVADGSLGRHGRFALTWVAPSTAARFQVRAVVYLPRGRVAVSAVRVVVVGPRKGPVVAVSPKTQVMAASTVTSAPSPGTAGVVTYAGGNNTQVGQIIAIGQGPATPDGYIGQVTSVTTSGGQTVVSTAPASVAQAVQSGSFDVTASTMSTSAEMRRTGNGILAHTASVKVQCEGSADASVTANVSVGASIEAKGMFSWFSLKSASVTAEAHASASIDAELGAAGSCTLAKTVLVTLPGPKLAFSIGFIPVVLTSTIPVYLDAGAQIDANISTSIGGGFTAQAGVGWTSSGGFYRIDQFTPSFSFQPPTLSANASIDANLTPTVQITLDGFAHANLALKAGLALNANIAANPWWTLTAPVAVTGNLDLSIPHVLTLSSPTLNIYRYTFKLATAGGPFNSSNGGGSSPGGGGSSPGGGGSNPGSGGSNPGGGGSSPGSGGSNPGGGSQTTYAETTGGVAHTWTNYSNAGGTEGPEIGSNQTVQIACWVSGFKVADGNTYWYEIASSPWNDAYYVSADAFYNNGATSGTLSGTPFVDPAVPSCSNTTGGTGGSSKPTYPETTGGVAHTWTNYSNAGGTEGPEIGSNQTVQIACWV
ncbi:MAG: hypothetical protein ACLP50_33145, partial [Solirubrobacteraceae bacterium]